MLSVFIFAGLHSTFEEGAALNYNSLLNIGIILKFYNGVSLLWRNASLILVPVVGSLNDSGWGGGDSDYFCVFRFVNRYKILFFKLTDGLISAIIGFSFTNKDYVDIITYFISSIGGTISSGPIYANLWFGNLNLFGVIDSLCSYSKGDEIKERWRLSFKAFFFLNTNSVFT